MNGETELKDSKKRIRITNSLAGEPWAIRDGLSMANNLGVKAIHVELDDQEAMI